MTEIVAELVSMIESLVAKILWLGGGNVIPLTLEWDKYEVELGKS